MLTGLCNLDLEPNFSVIKLGFAGSIHYVVISALKHQLWELGRTDLILEQNNE